MFLVVAASLSYVLLPAQGDYIWEIPIIKLLSVKKYSQ